MRRRKRIELTEGADRAVPRLKPTDELDWDVIHKELSGYFGSNEDAKSALARLVAAGCRERIILQNLYLFCGGKPQEMDAVRMALNFEGDRKRMLAIAALLQKAVSEIRVADQLLEDLDLSHNMTPDCSSLVRYANVLNRVGKVLYGTLASRRVSGRDQHLVFLSRFAERVTGNPHHREIADMVNATRQCYDPNSTKIENEESIRKRVSRHSLNLIVEVELEATLEIEGHPLISKTRK